MKSDLSFAEKYPACRKAAGLLTDLLFPRRCPVCDRPVQPFGALICGSCRDRPVRIGGATCRRCGKMLQDARTEYYRDCASIPHRYRKGAAVFAYRSVSGAVYRFKYEGRREYADYFAGEMADLLKEKLRSGYFERPDLLIPVPLSKERLRRRGYNQSGLLAECMAKSTGIAAETASLCRIRNTKPMKEMDLSDRRSNLNGAFHVYGNAVKCKKILIIDDIYTTGATIDACAEALYGAGASSVCFMTLAIGVQAERPEYAQ